MKKTIDINIARHSLAHVMAAAIKRLYNNVQFGVGPVIENGFYYDILLDKNLNQDDLLMITGEMRQIIKEKLTIKKEILNLDETIALFEKNNQPFKVELLNDLKTKGTTKIKEEERQDTGENVNEVTLYTIPHDEDNKQFVDLCRGPHVENTEELEKISWQIDRLAGAYWRGKESNPMMQRIYGLAFSTSKELDELLAFRIEQEKRDHRKLGKDLEIFTFSEEIGGGLPVWLPNGTVLREELEKLAKETEFIGGYDRVSTPVITKEDLFFKSGHLPHYKDSMYAPMDIDGENYYLKPMNCPFHHTVFQSKLRSYRDLPLRFTEYGLCHRYEKSGELQGLMRVRSMLMNDAHIYVRPDQVKEEIKKVLELHQHYYNLLGIGKIQYRLSKHDVSDLGGKYVNAPKEWNENEQILREVLQESGLVFFEAENEASFYGPKIDVQISSAIGKEYTIGTVQLDFAQPKKFELTYIDESGKEQMPYCIHRAPLSTHERFIAFLLEHFGGNFPLWLAPTQIRIASVANAHHEFCNNLAQLFRKEFIRAEVDNSNETIGNKVRKAATEKIPYVLVIGDKEMSGEMLSVRIRGQKEMLQISQEQFLKQLLVDIKERKLVP